MRFALDLRAIFIAFTRDFHRNCAQTRSNSRTNPAQISNESGRNCARFFRCGNQIDTDLLCSSLGLHTLALPKIGFASEKINEFVLFFTRLALSLSQVVTFSDGVLIELKKNKSLVLLDLEGY